MSKRYPQVTPEKTDREAMVACLEYVMKEFDRIHHELDTALEKVEKLTEGKSDASS